MRPKHLKISCEKLDLEPTSGEIANVGVMCVKWCPIWEHRRRESRETMPVRGGKAGMKPQGTLGSSQGEQGGRERVLPPKPRGLGDSF